MIENRKVSKATLAVILAYDKGYRVREDGIVVKPSGVLFRKDMRTDRSGYYIFSIRMGGTVYVKVHRLQYYQKYGCLIFNLNLLARHKNSNPLDNSFDNILIGTHTDNMNDIPKEIRINKSIAASRVMQSLVTKYDRFEIYGLLYSNTPYSYMVNKFGMSKGTLSFMKNKSIEYKEYIKTIV